MKIGFLTGALNELPLEEVAAWASEAGFQTLECGAWPMKKGQKGPNLDVAGLTKTKAAELARMMADLGLEISSLGYYDNMLAPEPAARTEKSKHLKKVIDAAELLGVGLVGCFIGRNPAKKLDENLPEVKKVFGPLCKYAADHGVRLMIENCPMVGWQFEGLVGNIACMPDMWLKIFDVLSGSEIGLNYDPSHLLWLGIDHVALIPEFIDRIWHTHAKDTEIVDAAYARDGIYGRNWWRYRMPGLGEIDWCQFISVLGEHGYNGVLSLEHEDPVWEGTTEKSKQGLVLARRHLARFLP
jgi:sugar phosphate isomerase/epimerase